MTDVLITSRDLIQIRTHILCAWHATQDPYAANQLDEASAIITEALRHTDEACADSGARVQALDDGDATQINSGGSL